MMELATLLLTTSPFSSHLNHHRRLFRKAKMPKNWSMWKQDHDQTGGTTTFKSGGRYQQHGLSSPNRKRFVCVLAILASIGIISQSSSSGLPNFQWLNRTFCSKTSSSSPFGPASPTLNWIPCGDRFQCSNLSVPLDYTNPNDERTASIAIVRYLASNRDAVNGTIIFNPGGPGGSGSGSTYRLGPVIDKVLQGKYDVLGFDPRGINLTLPRVNCMQSVEARTQLELITTSTAPSKNVHDIGIWDAFGQLIAEECEGNSGPDVLPFVNTPTVARDIASIVDALHAEKKHHVSYWGFSYGTNLGAIFTAMFPNKLHKIILDGIRSPFDAREVYEWGYTSVASQNDVFEGYFSICEKVGKSRCPLAGLEKSPKRTVLDLLDALYERPLPVSGNDLTGLVTFSGYKGFFYGTLYRGGENWKKFADITLDLLNGNGSSFLSANNPGPSGYGSSEWGTAVLCTDSYPATSYSLSSWKDYVQNMTELSYIAGDTRAIATLPCRHWYTEPNERWLGSFDDVALEMPVLMIGNTNDPATPLDSAKRLQKEMGKNAVLLTQDSYGHCSGSAASTCTSKVILDYILDGQLPEAGKLCEVDDKDYGDYFPNNPNKISELMSKIMAEIPVHTWYG
jgi:pimeloyl-ACP methyl ester carboxylesterase